MFTPLGSVLSSLMLSRLGHKNCMILTNVPYIMSQIMFFYATTVETLYACSILMGLSIGFSSGPCSAYVGEVCEPKRRGSLMSAVNVFSFVGYLVLTMIYSITMRWRLTILISIAIPVINTVLLYMVIIKKYEIARIVLNFMRKKMLCLRRRIRRCGCWPEENPKKRIARLAN